MTDGVPSISCISAFLDEAATRVLPSILRGLPPSLRRSLASTEIHSGEFAPTALFEEFRSRLVRGQDVWVIGLTADPERFRPALQTILRAAHDSAVGRSDINIGVVFPCDSLRQMIPWVSITREMPVSVFGLSPQWRGALLDSTVELEKFRQLIQTFMFSAPSRWDQPVPVTFSRLRSDPGAYAVGIETVDLEDSAAQSAILVKAAIFAHFSPCWSEQARSILKQRHVEFSLGRLLRATGSLPRLSERFTGDLLADTARSCTSLLEMRQELERLCRTCTGDVFSYLQQVVLELRQLSAQPITPGPGQYGDVSRSLTSEINRLFEIHPFPLIRYMTPNGVRPATLGHSLDSAFTSAQGVVAASIRASQYEHYNKLVATLTERRQQLDPRLPQIVQKCLGIENATEVGYLRYVPMDLSNDLREELLSLSDRAAIVFYARA